MISSMNCLTNKKNVLSTILLVLVITISAPAAVSKCPYQIYTVEGIICYRDKSGDIKHVQKALVSVFLDRYDYGYSGYASNKGEFSIKYMYSTSKGWFLDDICGKVPSSVTIIVSAEGLLTKKIKFKINGIKEIEGGKIINVPTIILHWVHPSMLFKEEK